MSRKSLLLWCIVLSAFVAGTVSAQDRSAMWNSAKRMKFGLDKASPVMPIQTEGEATVNTDSPPNTPDIQVFNPCLYWQSENSIGVNFSDANHLMVSTNGRIPGSNPVVHQTWAFSTDNGVTWPSSLQSEDNPPGIIDDFGDPVAFFDRSGRAYYCTLGSPGGIYFVSTTNFGATWSARTSGDPLNSSNDDKQHAAADYSGTFPNNVYTAWTDFGVTGTPIQFTRSTNQGATWGSRIALPIGSNRGQGVHIAIGPNGEVYVMWAHYTSGTAEVGIGMAKSTDGGATFNTPTVVYPINGIRISNGGITQLNGARAASFPYFDVDRSNGARRGWIYSVTPELDVASTGQADIYVHRSSDGGTTWLAAIKINGPDVQTGKWQFMPSIAVDPSTGGVSVSYYSMDSTGTNFMTSRYMAYSVDGGTTWDNFVISDVRALWGPQGTPNTNGTYNGDYYETAAMGGKAWALWTDRRSGPTGASNKAYIERVIYSENFGWVKGTVTNVSGGAQLPGVAIDFTDPILQQGGTSTATGFYVAGAKVDTPGTTRNVTLRARKFGFRDTTMAITLTRNDSLTRNFAMTPLPSGTLVVRTVRKDSTNIRSGIVVSQGGVTRASGFTDSLSGIFSALLPSGSYDVLVDPPSPYGNRRFSGVVIASGSTPLYVVVRAVVENSPAAVRDTLAVGGLHTKSLQLTNTTATDTVSYRLTDDNALARVQISKLLTPAEIASVERSKTQQDSHIFDKGVVDPRPGQSPDGSGGPDAFGYRWVDSDSIGGGVTFGWTDIRSVGTQITSWIGTGDDGYYTTALPWSFPIYGSGFSTIHVGTNGFVNFGVGSSSLSNSALPSTSAPRNGLFAYWDDLDTRTQGTVHYYNDVANSQYVVQYTDLQRYSGTSADTLTFQIIVKPNGEIRYNYLRMTTTVPNSASIGIQDTTGTIGLQVAFDAPYVHDRLAVRFYLPDATWLSESPSVGRINPGATQNITVTFDAAGLLPGTTYNGKILLDITHPDVTGSALIPASLRVNPATGPVIILSKTALSFPATEIGFNRRDSLVVRNGGTQILTLSSLATTNTRFTVTPANANVNPGDSVKVRVTYTAVAPARTDTGRVIILNNDPVSPRRDVSLTGITIGVAHMVVRPDTFAFTRNPTIDTTRTTFKVFNTGTDTLRYQINEASTSPLEDAAAVRRSTTQQTPSDLPKGAIDPTPGEADSSGGPDAFGYRWIDSDSPGGPPFSWVEISGVGTPVTTWNGSTDDGYFETTLTWPFPFYGTGYTNFFFTTNGWLGFNAPSSEYTNTAIPTTAVPNNAIYGWWDDLDAVGTSGDRTVYYYNDVANSRFIVEWNNVRHLSTDADTLKFQAIIKSNGEIVLQYLRMVSLSNLTASTIGIENTGGTVGLQTIFNAPYIHNNLAIRFSSDFLTWMSTDRTSGTIAPGDSQAVQLRIHPFGSPVATYYGVQRVTGNTPDVGRVRVGLRVITGVGENPSQLPMEFAISQNYPNPFNPTTKIKYDLPEQATVVLKIYNLLGQEIATLADAPQAAGYYEATWDGRNNFGANVSSGVYFYRFEATGSSGQKFANLKKMLFLK